MQTTERFSSLIANRDINSGVEQQDLLDNFIRGLVHDLNNPLGVFGMEVFMIRRTVDTLLDNVLASDLRGVTTQAQRLDDICDNLEGAIKQVGRLTDLLEQLGKK